MSNAISIGPYQSRRSISHWLAMAGDRPRSGPNLQRAGREALALVTVSAIVDAEQTARRVEPDAQDDQYPGEALIHLLGPLEPFSRPGALGRKIQICAVRGPERVVGPRPWLHCVFHHSGLHRLPPID